MRRESFDQLVPITGATPEEFAENYNRAQRQLRGKRTETIFDFAHGHVAYLKYSEEESVSESVKDEFELRGETHYCSECPYLERNYDGRVKWHGCRMGRTRLDNTACDYLYRQIESGEVEL